MHIVQQNIVDSGIDCGIAHSQNVAGNAGSAIGSPQFVLGIQFLMPAGFPVGVENPACPFHIRNHDQLLHIRHLPTFFSF